MMINSYRASFRSKMIWSISASMISELEGTKDVGRMQELISEILEKTQVPWRDVTYAIFEIEKEYGNLS